MPTILRGGTIADGGGGPLFDADVAIEGGRIAAIGPSLTGERVIDASGAVVAPGFIDIHTHYDAQIFWDPACTPSSWQGVTTVVIGNCGFGLAPCRVPNRAALVRMLVELEDMPREVLEAGIDWSFSGFGEFLAAVERLRPSLNVASYIGHSPVRIEVMGEDAYERAATGEEVARMAAIVAEAMREGAAGFATSTAPSGRRSATALADEREVVALARAMAGSGRGVVAMVPGGRTMGRARMYEIAADIGRPVTWTALLAMPDGSHRDYAALHRSHRRWGAAVHPQVSGRPQVAQTTLRTAFALRTPGMLSLDGCSDAERIAAYRDPAFRSRTALEIETTMRFPNDWNRWEVADSPRRPDLAGRSVALLASERGVAPIDALFDLVLDDGLATRFTVTQFNFDEAEVAALLRMDGAVLGLADSGAHPDQICDAVLPTDLLGRWVRDRGVLSLEQGVRKLTGELADLFGFRRGYVRTGLPADLTVFEPDRIGPGPLRRARDFPGEFERIVADRPTGLRHVIVNGEPIRLYGESLPRPAAGGAGQVLRGD